MDKPSDYIIIFSDSPVRSYDLGPSSVQYVACNPIEVNLNYNLYNAH